MLTKKDIQTELERAGIGPVVRIGKFREIFGLGQATPYHMIADGRLTRAGRATITRESIERLMQTTPEMFCRVYDYNRQYDALRQVIFK